MNKEQREALRAALREIGRLGGQASARSLTAKERIERARKAGKAKRRKR
jgi:hypothetical protein